MDEKAHVLTSEDQRYTGHSQVGFCISWSPHIWRNAVSASHKVYP